MTALDSPMDSKASPAADAGSEPPFEKQAVIVIHGMGEQIPMDTIKGLVHAVWETDKVITANGLPHPTQIWSKPDTRTGSLELRRVTTRESIKSPPEFPGGARTDFYELYWADLTAGTRWAEFSSWVRGLLFRRPRRVPGDVFLAWVLLWAAAIVVTLLGLVPLLPDSVWQMIRWSWVAEWRLLIIAGAGVLGLGVHNLATTTFGRVVRYTRADPDNIAAREAVRERGLKLLTALHEGSHYKRIIVVAHSLGTILALDLLSYFWAKREAARSVTERTPEFAALCALEKAAALINRANPDPQHVEKYFKAQREMRLALARRPAPNPNDKKAVDTRWIISDLVTLGSPLTHAEFLLAYDDDDLRNRKIAREIPEAPPFREDLDPKVLDRAIATNALLDMPPPAKSRLMSFPPPGKPDVWQLHHAAPFAAVRWTNIYDPAFLVFFGDLVGGPLADVLGPAIVDVNIKALRKRQSWTFTHTKYWSPTGGQIRINALRAAVNLLDRPDSNPNKL